MPHVNGSKPSPLEIHKKTVAWPDTPSVRRSLEFLEESWDRGMLLLVSAACWHVLIPFSSGLEEIWRMAPKRRVIMQHCAKVARSVLSVYVFELLFLLTVRLLTTCIHHSSKKSTFACWRVPNSAMAALRSMSGTCGPLVWKWKMIQNNLNSPVSLNLSLITYSLFVSFFETFTQINGGSLMFERCKRYPQLIRSPFHWWSQGLVRSCLGCLRRSPQTRSQRFSTRCSLSIVLDLE